MSINLGSNIRVQTTLPLDAKYIAADITARDAILAGERYRGMQVFVTADSMTYQLVAGITNSDWVPFGSGGGSGGGTLAAEAYAIPDATQTLVVTFPSNVGTSNYVVDWTIENLTDPSPTFLQGLVTAKSATSFTVVFDAPTDSTNYVLSYSVRPVSGSVIISDTVSLPDASQSYSVTFAGDIGTSTYSVDWSLENLTDPSPTFLQGMITSKLTTGFTIQFNALTDSTNYTLHYTART